MQFQLDLRFLLKCCVVDVQSAMTVMANTWKKNTNILSSFQSAILYPMYTNHRMRRNKDFLVGRKLHQKKMKNAFLYLVSSWGSQSCYQIVEFTHNFSREWDQSWHVLTIGKINSTIIENLKPRNLFPRVRFWWNIVKLSLEVFEKVKLVLLKLFREPM